MHDTNGMVTQLKSINGNPICIDTRHTSLTRKPKERSFKAISTELAPYLKNIREDPTHMDDTKIEVGVEKQDLNIQSLIDVC